MDWLIPALISILIGSTILFIVFSSLYYSEKTISLKYWSIAWGLTSLRYLIKIACSVVNHSPWLLIGNQSLALWSVVFVFMGAGYFVHRPFNYRWIVGCSAGLNAWLIAGILFKLPFIAVTMPTFTVMGGVFIWTGTIFNNHGQSFCLERRVAEWTFILWGIHKLSYPFVASRVWLAPWGYLISAAFSLSAALSIILLYFRITREELEESHARFLRVTENANDIIYRMSLPDGKYEYISPACLTVGGYTQQEFYANPLFLREIIHPDFADALQNHMDRVINGRDHSPFEYKIFGKSGNEIWLNQKSMLIRDTHDHPIAIEGIVRDVTESKRLEENLKRMSLHDPLTGLYNRSFFEEEIRRLNDERHMPVGLLVCDIDGLKIINDTLGHPAGDKQLRTTAGLLKSCFRQSDILARIGGDEFAALLPGCNEQIMHQCRERIFERLGAHNDVHPELSISLSTGFAIQESSPLNFNDLFKRADDNMYKEKLQQAHSSRSATVQALIKTMEARDYITEGHASRLQEHAQRLGKLLGVPEDHLNDLSLLARFHDLGKVGIPDRILFKPGPLTGEEYELMKTHCEIGRRIAMSASDLAPIAGLILKHHEWWDGRGYPLGLKGEKIPIECRILSIVDAYDAMTSKRPYKKAMPHYEAVQELRQCAGTQFDPELVEKFIEVVERHRALTMLDQFSSC